MRQNRQRISNTFHITTLASKILVSPFSRSQSWHRYTRQRAWCHGKGGSRCKLCNQLGRFSELCLYGCRNAIYTTMVKKTGLLLCGWKVVFAEKNLSVRQRTVKAQNVDHSDCHWLVLIVRWSYIWDDSMLKLHLCEYVSVLSWSQNECCSTIHVQCTWNILHITTCTSLTLGKKSSVKHTLMYLLEFVARNWPFQWGQNWNSKMGIGASPVYKVP